MVRLPQKLQTIFGSKQKEKHNTQQRSSSKRSLSESDQAKEYVHQTPSSKRLSVQDIRMNVRRKSSSEQHRFERKEQRDSCSGFKIFDGTEIDLESPWASFLLDEGESDSEDQVKDGQEQKSES